VVTNRNYKHSAAFSGDFLVSMIISVHRSTSNDIYRPSRLPLTLKIQSLSDMNETNAVGRVRVGANKHWSFRRMHIFAPAVGVHEMDMSDMATGKFVFEMDVSY
jgi:hypothetical protein